MGNEVCGRGDIGHCGGYRADRERTTVRICVYGYAVELSGPAIPDRHKFNCFGCTIYRRTQDIIVHPYDAKTRLVDKIEELTHAAPFTTPFSFYFPVPVHFLREE